MTSLSFVVPGKPVPYQRVVPYDPNPEKSKRRRPMRPYQPPEAKAYQNLVAWSALGAANGARWKVPGEKTRLALIVRVYRTARRGDLSNFVKIIEDGINDAKNVWIDDRYVVSLNASMAISKENPRVEVEVRVLEDPT